VLFLQDYDVDVSDTTMVTTLTILVFAPAAAFRGAQAGDTTIVTPCFHNNFVNFLNRPNMFRFS
jgi:hypothetical protein